MRELMAGAPIKDGGIMHELVEWKTKIQKGRKKNNILQGPGRARGQSVEHALAERQEQHEEDRDELVLDAVAAKLPWRGCSEAGFCI